MRRNQLLTILLVCLLTVPTVALADTSGSPDLSATVQNGTLAAGGETQLTVVLQNSGEVTESSNPQFNAEVTTAKGVKATLQSDDAPVTVKSGTQSAGSIPNGGLAQVPFTVTVDQDAEPGTYTLPVKVRYTYTSEVDQVGQSQSAPTYDYDTETETETLNVRVTIEDRARFQVVNASTDAPVGDRGPVSVAIENVGSEPARNANVAIESSNGDFTFSGTPSASSYVGRWEPGEVRNVTVEGTFAEGAAVRNYALGATVSYENTNGAATQSDRLNFGVTPTAEQSFEVENVQSSLRVGSEGALEGELVNTGETTARNVVVSFDPENGNVNPLETEYAVGNLAPGERANFSFDTEVTDSADAGPRLFSLDVRYRNAAGERREGESLDVSAAVEPARKKFLLQGVNASFEPGENGELLVELTNNDDETVRDVSAKLFVDAPITSSNSEAFVSELGPGETTTLKFGAGVAGDALAGKTYPVSMDFRYETPDGDARISETYQVPVQVTEPEDDGGFLDAYGLIVGGGLLLMVVGGVVLYFRRE
ncbi:COG1361 S-layer family protein [Halobium salinum]|uniref:COG1361 S-layer family protein n=1 Tax=Halobium salinum TaxID=1364940 RepID=A0ABD5P6Q6_9EURY|nr:COG1361 S-layer family protein [Halobium salinum]